MCACYVFISFHCVEIFLCQCYNGIYEKHNNRNFDYENVTWYWIIWVNLLEHYINGICDYRNTTLMDDSSESNLHDYEIIYIITNTYNYEDMNDD